ncbi:hypothetical protein FRC12_014219 [Ceratobasidium sp. 428]|nr:hypothetical protein FRC12_014219 [Ceratobasidium sp. 428]
MYGQEAGEDTLLYVRALRLFTDSKDCRPNLSRTRKRKAPQDAPPHELPRTKQQKISPNPSSDAELLVRIVTKCVEPTLRQTLASSLAAASPSDIQVVKRLLDPLVTPFQNPLHCVRCHEPYIQHENKWDACKIPHLDPVEVAEYRRAYEDDYSEDGSMASEKGCLMMYPCCGEKFRSDKPHLIDGPCVECSHTTNPGDVRYYVDPDHEIAEKKTKERKKEKKGKKKNRNFWLESSSWTDKNPNVVTCKERGCIGA